MKTYFINCEKETDRLILLVVFVMLKLAIGIKTSNKINWSYLSYFVNFCPFLCSKNVLYKMKRKCLT